MRFQILLLLLMTLQLGMSQKVKAQEISKPVTWSYKISPQSYKAGDTLTIRFTGVLENGWFIYSVENDTVDYVSPASFRFTPNPSFALQGKVTAPNVVLHRDDLLEEDFKVLKNDALFVQKVVVKKMPVRIDVVLDYTLSKEDDDEGTVVILEERFKVR